MLVVQFIKITLLKDATVILLVCCILDDRM